MQIPSELPHPDDNSPLDLSNPADVIIYIILPIVVFGLYFIWRWQRKRERK